MRRPKARIGRRAPLAAGAWDHERARAFYDKQMLAHLNPAMREVHRAAGPDVSSPPRTPTASATVRFARGLPASSVCSTRRPSRTGAPGQRCARQPGQPRRKSPCRARVLRISARRRSGCTSTGARASSTRCPVRLAARSKSEPNAGSSSTSVEAYIHCSKHIPLMKKLDKSVDWGTDDHARKRGRLLQRQARAATVGPVHVSDVPTSRSLPLGARGRGPPSTTSQSLHARRKRWKRASMRCPGNRNFVALAARGPEVPEAWRRRRKAEERAGSPARSARLVRR